MESSLGTDSDIVARGVAHPHLPSMFMCGQEPGTLMPLAGQRGPQLPRAREVSLSVCALNPINNFVT